MFGPLHLFGAGCGKETTRHDTSGIFEWRTPASPQISPRWQICRWENPEQYIQHSPVFFATKFSTPTMIITGQADCGTPIAQGEELYFALKARKIHCILVEIPDEPHGLRGSSPSHRVARNGNLLAWIDKYTKSSGSEMSATGSQ